MSRRSTPAAASASGPSTSDRQHSINVSYAYGAPATLSPATGTRASSNRAASARARSTSVRSASVDNAQPVTDDIGRPEEPALVRYAKMKQRRKDTGQPFPAKNKPPADSDLRDTSVNIATAFRTATGPSDMIIPTDEQLNQSIVQDDVSVAGPAASRAHDEADEDVDESEDDHQKETHIRPQTNGKKRKKHATIDPAFQPPTTASESEADSDGHTSKKARQEAAAESPKSQPMRKRKSKDTSYKPSRDEQAQAEESSELTDDNPRQRRGRRSREVSGGNQAIPRGHRDGEVWYGGKKRKGRRRSRPSSGTDAGAQEENDDDEEGAGADEDLGGMDDEPGDLSLRAELEQTGSTSIFLRPAGSPSPERLVANGTAHQPEASTSRATFLSPPSNRGNRGLFFSNDQSLQEPSSYDYTTEEQLLREYEREEAARRARQARAVPAAVPSARSLPMEKRNSSRIPTPEAGPPPAGLAFGVGRALRAIGRALDKAPFDAVKLMRAASIAGLAMLVFWALARRPVQSGSQYSPSGSLPESMPEFAERLLKLENAISGMHSAQNDGSRRVDLFDSDLRTLNDRVRRIEREDTTDDVRAIRTDLRAVERLIDGIKAEVADEKRSLSSLQATSKPAVRIKKGRVVIDPAVDRYLKDTLAREAIPSDLVDRKTMSDAIRREIKALKRDFENQANENVQKIGEELLAKYAKAEQLKASTGSNPFSRGSISDDALPSNDALNAIIDAAILRYSKDILARPDYALFTAGARVIPSLTSPTYEAKAEGGFAKTLGWITGKASIVGRPPATALHPDNSLGSCWPFRGSHGQLGVLLSRRVVPSDITIEHVSADVALEGDVRSAPRDFEVWGVVEDATAVERLKEHRRAVTERRETNDEQGDLVPTSVPPTLQHILLARGSYDTARVDPRQTFALTEEAAQVRAPVSIVVLKILSNHGDPNYTCLYRIRVGGETIGKA